MSSRCCAWLRSFVNAVAIHGDQEGTKEADAHGDDIACRRAYEPPDMKRRAENEADYRGDRYGCEKSVRLSGLVEEMRDRRRLDSCGHD